MGVEEEGREEERCGETVKEAQRPSGADFEDGRRGSWAKKCTTLEAEKCKETNSLL